MNLELLDEEELVQMRRIWRAGSRLGCSWEQVGLGPLSRGWEGREHYSDLREQVELCR